MADHTRPTRRDGGARSRRDRGSTYIEVVITLVLTGVVVLPVLAAVRSSIQAAAVSRDAAEVETVLINAADRVSRADRYSIPTLKCDLVAPARKAANVHGWDESTVSVTHEHWDRDGGVFLAGACPAAGFSEGLVQRVTITVSSPSGNVTRELEVIKGDF